MSKGNGLPGGRPRMIAALLAGALGLGLGALGGAGPGAAAAGGSGCPAPGGPAGKETIVGLDGTARSPGRRGVPPLDLEAPERTGIAVFGLG